MRGKRKPCPGVISVGRKAVADFAQGVLPRELRVKADEELPPGGEMSAVVIGAVRLDGFRKRCGGRNWKSWEKTVL